MAGATGGGEALTQTPGYTLPRGPQGLSPGGRDSSPASSTAQPSDTWPPALLSGPMFLEKASENHIGFRTKTGRAISANIHRRAHMLLAVLLDQHQLLQFSNNPESGLLSASCYRRGMDLTLNDLLGPQGCNW